MVEKQKLAELLEEWNWETKVGYTKTRQQLQRAWEGETAELFLQKMEELQQYQQETRQMLEEMQSRF